MGALLPSFYATYYHHYCYYQQSCRQFTHKVKIERHDFLSLGREEKKRAGNESMVFLGTCRKQGSP